MTTRSKPTKGHVPFWVFAVGVTTLAIALASGAALVINALAFAGITFMGLLVFWYKSGPEFKLFTLNWPNFTDVVIAVITYKLMGSGVTAMIGAGITGFGFNIFFEWADKNMRLSLEKQVAAIGKAKQKP